LAEKSQASIQLLARPPPAITILSKHSASCLPAPKRPLIANPLKDLYSLSTGKRKPGKDKFHSAEGQITINQADLVSIVVSQKEESMGK